MLFTKRTHKTYMQTFILNILICTMKNFPEYWVLEAGIDEDQMNLPQPHGTLGSKKKVLVDLREKRPNSYRIQLGISCSSLTMIWLKKWDICCKDKRIFQSQLVQNWKIVSGMLAPLDNPVIFAKEVVEHHLSFQKLIKVHVPIV